MEIPELPNPFTAGKLVGAGIDSDAYHRQEPGVERGHPQFVLSRSELMLFASCPARWKAGYAPKETDATAWGNLMDCRVTDPGRFETKFALQPETVSATKSMKAVQSGEVREGDKVPWQDCKEAREWKKAHAGKQIVSAEEWKDSGDALARLAADSIITEYLNCSAKQVMCVAEYHDRANKIVVPVKMLIDLVPDKAHANYGYSLGDFKTCRNAAPEEWEGDVHKRHYDAQAAMNLWGYNAATGESRTGFYHVISENLFPWQPARRSIDPMFISIGQMKVIDALRRYARALATGVWPSWDDEGDENYRGWGACRPKDWVVAKFIGRV